MSQKGSSNKNDSSKQRKRSISPSSMESKKRKMADIRPLENIELNEEYLSCFMGENICAFKNTNFQEIIKKCKNKKETSDAYIFIYHISKAFLEMDLIKTKKNENVFQIIWNKRSPFFPEWILQKKIIEQNIIFLFDNGFF